MLWSIRSKALRKSNEITLIYYFTLRREPQYVQAVFFPGIKSTKGKSWSQAFLAQTVETWDKNRDVTDNIKTFSRAPCMFCEESFWKIETKDVEVFRNGSGTWVLSLESVDYFGTSEYYFSGRKKWMIRKNNNKQIAILIFDSSKSRFFNSWICSLGRTTVAQ